MWTLIHPEARPRPTPTLFAFALLAACGSARSEGDQPPNRAEVTLAPLSPPPPATWGHAQVVPKPNLLLGDGALALKDETPAIWTWEVGLGAGFLFLDGEASAAASCSSARLVWAGGKLAGTCSVVVRDEGGHFVDRSFIPDLLTGEAPVRRASGCRGDAGRASLLPTDGGLLHVVPCNGTTTIYDEVTRQQLVALPDLHASRAAVDSAGTIHLVGAGPKRETTYASVSRSSTHGFEIRSVGLRQTGAEVVLAAPTTGPVLFAYTGVDDGPTRVSSEPPIAPHPRDEAVADGDPVALDFAAERPVLAVRAPDLEQFEVFVRSRAGWRSLGTPPVPSDHEQVELIDAAGTKSGLYHVLYSSIDPLHGAKLHHAWIDTR